MSVNLQFQPRPKSWVMQFAGFGNEWVFYPRYFYKDNEDPLLVHNTEEEVEARANGYDNVAAGVLANRHLINWFWDLEDMSARQLAVFAKDEYGVDLPVEAGQTTLYKAVVELVRNAPQNRGSLVLMAHTIELQYDATIEEIKRRMRDCEGVVEKYTFEVAA